MKIAIAGMGYVGLSLAVLLAQHHTVYAVDIAEEKVEILNNRKSPIRDSYIESYLSNKDLDIVATTDARSAYESAEFVIIAVPTNYDSDRNSFDTSAVEAVVQTVLRYNPNAVMVIKSTVPIGYTDRIREEFRTENILFSPEFLREGKALYDNLYPSRIIVGTDLNNKRLTEKADLFAGLLEEGAEKKTIETLLMGFSEAEAVKLFANAYLAMRISYFNELDTFAEMNGLNTDQIIRGVCLDPRIGMYYNNPSFGYGGYCLPKDTKQLLASYRDVPESLIRAVVTSNQMRKNYIAERICSKLEQIRPSLGTKKKIVGIYRLSMKSNSDNFRFSSIFDVIEKVRDRGYGLILYEPLTRQGVSVKGCECVSDINEFKRRADLIIANRFDEGLADVKEKVYTRDLFGRD